MARSRPESFDPKLPGMSDDALKEATGKGWTEWVELINAWPGSVEGHTAVANWVSSNFPVEGWWAQGITVGWERLTGRRQLHQQADGTFTASSSRTLKLNFDHLKARLYSDADRDEFLGLESTTVTSRRTSKSVRIRYQDASILIDSYPNPDGRIRLTVTHEKLLSGEDVPVWKDHWSEWLAALPED